MKNSKEYVQDVKYSSTIVANEEELTAEKARRKALELQAVNNQWILIDIKNLIKQNSNDGMFAANHYFVVSPTGYKVYDSTQDFIVSELIKLGFKVDWSIQNNQISIDVSW